MTRLPRVAIALAVAAAGCGGKDVPPNWVTPTDRVSHQASFPIATGFHAAADCNDCHGGFASFKEFACTTCHTEPQNGQMHPRLPGYAPDGPSCVRCHPRGTVAVPGDHATAFFPIGSGTAHADVACAQCHLDMSRPNDPTAFACYACHSALPTGWPHFDSVGGVAILTVHPSRDATLPVDVTDPATCLRCHADSQVNAVASHPASGGFARTEHAAAGCLTCHSATRVDKSFGADFSVAPAPGSGSGCGTCHGTGLVVPAGTVRNPASDVAVTGLVPSYAGTSITRVTPLPQLLPMGMNHLTAAIDSATLANCGGCHLGAASGVYYPGSLHSALANQALPQPAACLDCHAGSMPVGFVGPFAANPPRTPPSGEMKHDAVAWAAGAPTATPIVGMDCAVCHASPSAAVQATWATAPSGGGLPVFHASLDAARLAQPVSCVDCHANSRPAAALTSATAALPPQVTFDHRVAPGLDDCATCHAGAGPAGFTSWSGGRLHLAAGSAPATCLPCHADERPTSTSGWASATFTASPFDYVTNAAGITHGDGQDCVLCHGGPGTGAWGGTQNWQGGYFIHGPGTPAATTCIACHMSQRPDLQPGATPQGMASILGFDHSVNGTGDCFGCHQATVQAGRYVHYASPATGGLPGGDWAGGSAYPGATLVSAGNRFITVTAIMLIRDGPANLVTTMAATSQTLYDGMTHVSVAIPAQVNPGPAQSPDPSSCWHCHTSTGGVVSSYAGGLFHASLTAYSATPGGTVTPLPQPTGRCADCHAQMRPAGIVELSESHLEPMDHAALFAAPANVGGATVAGVAELDCSACHRRPGETWGDGVFHANIGSAVPQDCVVCHYPLVADTFAADVTLGARYAMSHQSPLVTVQHCGACHASALSRSTTTPVAATLWQTGVYHASVAAQPAACLDCHAGSAPIAATQSTVVYALAMGGTATNGAQWMNHSASAVVAVDCASCHAADAKPSGAAWSRSTPFHASAPSPGQCQVCHGFWNFMGVVAGFGNNLPAGLIDSSTLTTASDDPTTGVPVGTHDQIDHTDANALYECSFCHQQAGPSTAPGIRGREWAQARFHASFSPSAPLVMNGTNGRCSNCHMNLKPGGAYAAKDHSTLTNTPGTQDCSFCHFWPGTGTAASPNWLGAGDVPQFLSVGGFAIPVPPASAPALQVGIANLPHPRTFTVVGTPVPCSICHQGGVGGRGAIAYDHASPLISFSCNACHEAGSDLVGTPWNGATTQAAGAGDTRPYTLTSLTVNGGSCLVTTPNHFYPVDCAQCHAAPPGYATTTAGPAYTSAFAFPHDEARMTNPATCNLCHGAGCPN
ncbi:MAG TPA: hypothetical protein VFR85_18845 [Anaeromyxobacteraceae bacterium]|nr:hypothetical protein [Anaeromyxobacteraceae bacterium]